MQIYLLWRPDGTQAVTQRIADLIRSRYRAEIVWDVPMPDSAAFAQRVETTMQPCNAVLVVIGPDWLRARSPRGLPWQDDPSDPVAVGLVAALRQKKLIVPLLVHGAAMPSAGDLTPQFAALVLHQGVVLREDPLFLTDLRKAYTQLNTQLAWRPASTLLLLTAIGSAVSTVASVAIALAIVSNQGSLIGPPLVALIIAILLSLALSFSALIGAFVLAVQRKQPGWLAALIVLALVGIPALVAILAQQEAAPIIAWQLLSAVVIAMLALFGKRREMV
jgi:hypothetical protein